MTCQDVQQRLYDFLDGALDSTTSDGIQDHLHTCRHCRHEVAGVASLEDRLRAVLRNEPVPATLWSRITADLEHQGCSAAPATRRRMLRAWLIPAAAACLVLALGWAWFTVQDLHTFVVSQRALDVVSSDPQHLRTWFLGKVEFPPPLLPTQFGRARLAGGRLCYFLGRRVASFMYTADGHYLSLYIMPRQGLPRPRPDVLLAQHRAAFHEMQGYTHVLWSQRDLLYSLVSDVPHTQLLEMAWRVVQEGV
jgi:anti-sigma factor (TIGR02949 family)